MSTESATQSAAQFLDAATREPDPREAQANAVIAIGYALLAILERLEAER